MDDSSNTLTPLSPQPCCFDAIVVTAPNERAARASVIELRVAYSRACLPSATLPVLLAVADPNGARIGSGGGTLNALDAAARALTARALGTQETEGSGDAGACLPLSDVLAAARQSRILVIHSGGDSQRSPLQSVCGKAWCALSSSSSSSHAAAPSAVASPEASTHPSQLLTPPRTPVELLLGTLCRMSGGPGEGLPRGSSVVACSDVLLLVPPDLRLRFLSSANKGSSGGQATSGAVTGLALSADLKYGPHHGVYACDPPAAGDSSQQRDGLQRVRRFLQKASLAELHESGAVDPRSVTATVPQPLDTSASGSDATTSSNSGGSLLVDTGVIAFDQFATCALLSLCAMPPLNGTTNSAYVRHAQAVKKASMNTSTSAPADIGIGNDSADDDHELLAAPIPVRVELYSDMLLAVGDVGGFASNGKKNGDNDHNIGDDDSAAEARYLTSLGSATSSSSSSSAPLSLLDQARRALWASLHPLAFGACVAGPGSGSQFGHMGTTKEAMAMVRGEVPAFVAPFGIQPRVLAYLSPDTAAHPSAGIVNSSLELHSPHTSDSCGANELNSLQTPPPPSAGTAMVGVSAHAVVEHSLLSGRQWFIGEGSIVSGLRHIGHAHSAEYLTPSSAPLVPEASLEAALAAATKTSRVVPTSSAATVTSESSNLDAVLCALMAAASLARSARYELIVPPGMCVQENALGPDDAGVGRGLKREEGVNNSSEMNGLFTVTLLAVSDGIKDVYDPSIQEPPAASSITTVATVCGVPWAAFFRRSGLVPEDIWPMGLRQDLWHAKLYPKCYASPVAVAATEGDPCMDGKQESDGTAGGGDGIERANSSLPLEPLANWRAHPEALFWPLWLSSGIDPSPEAVTRWRLASRCSLRDLLQGVADPAAEGVHKRHVETVVGQAITAKAMQEVVAPAVASAARFVHRREFAARALEAIAAAATAAGGGVPGVTAEAAAKSSSALASATDNRSECKSAEPSTSLVSPLPMIEVPPGWRAVRSVRVKAPARVDIAGGWSDTPPISYEHGGCVTNLAVSVDGHLPIEATVTVLERIDSLDNQEISKETGEDSPCLWLSTGDDSHNPAVLALSKSGELADCSSPSAPAALLKAGLLTALVVSLNDDNSPSMLEGQLKQSLHGEGSGLWITTRSALPQGSGLGTSSIMAGCLLSALAHVTRCPFDDPLPESPISRPPRDNALPSASPETNNSTRSSDNDNNNSDGSLSLVHAVLMLEQLMTTGGGWQDQAGGCSPWAATIASSKAQLPLQVQMACAAPPGSPSLAAVSAHLCLVYTGQPRLAKNLLVEVLRRWWASAPHPRAGAAVSDDGNSAEVTSNSQPANDSSETVNEEGTKGEEERAATADVTSLSGIGVRATVDVLVRDATRAAVVLKEGNLPMIGHIMNRYHALKRNMAGPTYEPPALQQLVESLQPFAHGVACCGAGGGGFLALLCKEPCNPGTSTWDAIAEAAANHGGTVHEASLVEGGLHIEHLNHV